MPTPNSSPRLRVAFVDTYILSMLPPYAESVLLTSSTSVP